MKTACHPDSAARVAVIVSGRITLGSIPSFAVRDDPPWL
jgi:hypothetical protein